MAVELRIAVTHYYAVALSTTGSMFSVKLRNEVSMAIVHSL